MESLIFLEQIFSIVGLNNSQTISIYRRHPKGTFYRRLPPGGRHPSGAWRCVGRRPVIGDRIAPLQVYTDQRRGSRGRNLRPRAGVQRAEPSGALSSGLSPEKVQAPAAAAPGGWHPPPALPTRWGPAPPAAACAASRSPPARGRHLPAWRACRPSAAARRKQKKTAAGLAAVSFLWHNALSGPPARRLHSPR